MLLLECLSVTFPIRLLPKLNYQCVLGIWAFHFPRFHKLVFHRYSHALVCIHAIFVFYESQI